MSRPSSPPPDKLAKRRAAYERGWVNSLDAYDARSRQPIEDIYDYMRGWHDCAAYRWKDPNGRGIAPDPTYRPPQSVIDERS